MNEDCNKSSPVLIILVNSIKLSHTYKYIKKIMSEKLIQSNFHTPTKYIKKFMSEKLI